VIFTLKKKELIFLSFKINIYSVINTLFALNSLSRIIVNHLFGEIYHMKIEGWRSKPIENEIILTLVKNRGEMLTNDLYRVLNNTYQDFGMPELMDLLFRLEVRSYIYVVQIKKDVWKIEINPKAHLSDDLMRQIKNI